MIKSKISGKKEDVENEDNKEIWRIKERIKKIIIEGIIKK